MQILIEVKIESFFIDLAFVVVPKLVKDVILGIDSIKKLKIINTSKDYIKFDNNNIEIKYSELNKNDKNSINIINELLSTCAAIENSTEFPSCQYNIQDELMKKVEAADELTNNEKLQMCALLRKYSSVFSKHTGKLKNFEYSFVLKDDKEYFKKNISCSYKV